MDDDDKPWYRPLLVGLGALLGVAVLVGGLIGVVALGVVNVAGIGEERTTVQEQEPTLLIPERTPGARSEDDDPGLTLEDLNGGVDPTESDSPSESATPSTKPEKKKRKPPKSVISLSSGAVEVAPMQRIDLTGTYPGGEGASLQVQRFAGGWRDFAGVTATVRNGTFSTYVMTGRSGRNRFRVVDTSSGKTSNPVTVRVR